MSDQNLLPTSEENPREVDEDVPAPQGADEPRRLTPLVSGKRAWGMTGIVTLLYIVNYADKAVLGIIAQPLARDLGLSSSQIGLVSSLFFLAFTIGGFFAGALNRYLILRWSLLLLAIIWSVVMLPLVFAASLATLIVCRMALGLAEGPTAALTHTATYSWHPPAKRGVPGAVLAGSASVAKIVLAPALAFIAVEMGWRATLIALSLLGVVWMVLWLTFWQEGPYASRRIQNDGSDSSTGDVIEPTVPWSRIFLSRTFVSCAVLIIAVYALSSVVLTWLPSYFEVGLGYSALQAGSMFALPSIAALILMLTMATVTDRFRARGASSRRVRIVLPALGIFVGGAILIVLPTIGAAGMAVAAVSIGYAFVNAAFPLINAAISELCPPQQTAGTMGVFLALMAIGGLVAPYATGVIVDNAATKAIGYAQSFQAIGAVAVAAAVLVLVFANPDRDKKIIRSI